MSAGLSSELVHISIQLVYIIQKERKLGYNVCLTFNCDAVVCNILFKHSAKSVSLCASKLLVVHGSGIIFVVGESARSCARCRPIEMTSD